MAERLMGVILTEVVNYIRRSIVVCGSKENYDPRRSHTEGLMDHKKKI